MDQVECVREEVLRVAGGEVEAGGGRRVEAVDVVQLDRVEALPRAHGHALAEHGLQRVQLAGRPSAPRESRSRCSPSALPGKTPPGVGVGPVIFPGQFEVADRARVGEGTRLPAGLDRADLRPGGEEAVDVVDVHRVAPGPLQRGGPADLPVPAHRVAGTVQVRRVPALGLDRVAAGGRVDVPAEGDRGGAVLVGGAHGHLVRSTALACRCRTRGSSAWPAMGRSRHGTAGSRYRRPPGRAALPPGSIPRPRRVRCLCGAVDERGRLLLGAEGRRGPRQR